MTASLTRLVRRRCTAAGAASDAGSAVVEFVFLAVVLMVPLLHLVMVMARLQAGSYAVTAAAREAGRAYVTAPASGQAAGRAQAAAAIAFSDQGFGSDGAITVSCSGSPCLQPEGRVQTTARVVYRCPSCPTSSRPWCRPPSRSPRRTSRPSRGSGASDGAHR